MSARDGISDGTVAFDQEAMATRPGITVRDNPAELRYELLFDGQVIGQIRYRIEDDAVALVHTEVDPGYKGQGLATRLIEEALLDLRLRGRRVIPICPFVRRYIGRHPEFGDLVAKDPELE